YFGEGLEPGVRRAVEEALRVLEGMGATLDEVSLPSTGAALSTYYIIAPAECSSNLARYDGIRFGMRKEHDALLQMYLDTRGCGFGAEVKRRIMLGTYALSSGYYDAYYRKAQKVRTVIAEEFAAAFERVDALVCATSPTVAFPLAAREDPLSMYLCDVLTLPVNLAGLPGVSLPCGMADGLPVGLQVIAPRFQDARALRVAHAYEQATGWHRARPPLVEAAEYTVRTAVALNCEIPEFTKFDRKNYFYPDLPKGYQISQYDLPLSRRGWLQFHVDGEQRRCGITRVHLEEDTGTMYHAGDVL